MNRVYLIGQGNKTEGMYKNIFFVNADNSKGPAWRQKNLGSSGGENKLNEGVNDTKIWAKSTSGGMILELIYD